MRTCPRCHCLSLEDEKALNSLSRRDGETYICNRCGNEEAMIDGGYLEPTKNEKEFVKTHKRTKDGYETKEKNKEEKSE